MAEFDYTAFDSFGENQEGRLEASTIMEASQILKERKWIIRTLDESSHELSLLSQISPASYILTSQDFEIAFAQLSTLLSSGVNLLAAMKTLSYISLKQASRDLWQEIHEKVQSGESFSESLKQHPKFKKSLLSNLIKIGEETGELDQLLLNLSVAMERNRVIKSKILSALLYPLFVFCIALTAGGVAVFYLIPKLQLLITAMGRDLHPLTKVLVSFAESCQKYSLHTVLFFIFAIIAFTIAFLNTEGRSFIDRKALKIPIIGTMLRTYFSAEFARNFAMLLKSGVKLTDSIKHCADATWNSHLKSILNKARTNIINGSALTETIAYKFSYSPILISMISVGEKTGSLDNLLEEQANYHYQLLDKQINRFSAFISFIMLLSVAGTIAFVFAAILLTYFS